MEQIAVAGDAIRALELRLGDEGLFARVEVQVTPKLRLGWVRDGLTRRWRLMSISEGGKAPQPRPLVEQPATVKVEAHPHLDEFEAAVRRAWAER